MYVAIRLGENAGRLERFSKNSIGSISVGDGRSSLPGTGHSGLISMSRKIPLPRVSGGFQLGS